MNKLVIVIAVLACACGTKQNPRACCTDAADCMNVGLPNGTTCDEGLLCRGNRCVEEPCQSSAACDVSAPYCVKTDEGRCAEACTQDSQCPGFGQAAEQTFCVDGGCAECRAGMNDCPANAPVCSSMGTCVTCEAHTDCASGVCAEGRCASDTDIAHVATNGSPTSNCERATPCSNVTRALAVIPAKPYVLVEPGAYTSTSEIALSGVRWVIGRGTNRPAFTRSTDGPIFTAMNSVDARLENIEVFGAHGASSMGTGILCMGAPAKLQLVNAAVRTNQFDGLQTFACSVEVSSTVFEGNGNYGVKVTDSNGDFDRCVVSGNGGGMSLDNGTFQVTNSFVVRNTNTGIDLSSFANGSAISFNTFVDNGVSPTGFGALNCNNQPNSNVVNNIFARNTPTLPTGNCIAANSIIDANIAPLKFKSPDVAPYDYHIQLGSSAVDLGSVPLNKYDFDGESRPFGNGADIGADELH